MSPNSKTIRSRTLAAMGFIEQPQRRDCIKQRSKIKNARDIIILVVNMTVVWLIYLLYKYIPIGWYLYISIYRHIYRYI